MATIVQNPDFGTGVGQALGSGLSQAFQLLAQKKLKEMSRQESARGLQALGYSPEQALQLANLDPAILREAIKQRGKEAETSRFGEALSLLAGGSVAQPEQQLLQVLQQPSIQEQQLQPQQQFEQVVQPNIKDLLSAAGVYPQAPKPTPLIPPSKPEAIKPALATLSPTAQEMKQALPELKTITPSDVARIAKQTKLTAQQFKDLNQIAQDNQRSQLASRKQQFLEEKETKKAERENQREINKETKAVFDDTLKEDKAAKEADQTLKKMVNLINKGNLPPAALYNFVHQIEEKVPPAQAALVGGGLGATVGGPIGGLIGGALGALVSPVASLIKSGINLTYPDSEEFNKLSNSFIRGAKAIFGARITDRDLQAFLAQVPTLSQTDAGKRAIIKNMEIFNKAAHARSDALKKIIKENKGKRPENLAILIDEVAGPELDKITEQFVTV